MNAVILLGDRGNRYSPQVLPSKRKNDAGTGQSCCGATKMAELPPVMRRRPGVETRLLQMLDQLCKRKPARSDCSLEERRPGSAPVTEGNAE